MASIHSLGSLQIEILRVLWRLGEAPVTQVHRELQVVKPLAPTTVSTMLVKMEKRGLLSHRTEGRKFIYQPLVAEHEVKQSMVGNLTDLLFGGDVTALVSHLMASRDIDRSELGRLRALIDSAEGDRDHDQSDD